MKTGFLVTMLAATLLAAATSGNVLAAQSGANSADPESAMNQTWMGHGPAETGMLPDASSGASDGSRIVSGGTDIPMVETGGTGYRPGIDTGP